MSDALGRLEYRLSRDLKETCERYQLLAPGDRIMVAMSGGKDSYTLFHLLTRLVPRLPFAVELIAVHLDQVQPGYDGAGLRAYLEASGRPFEILREDTYSVVTEHLPEDRDLLLAVLAPAPRHPLHRRRAARLQQDRARPPPRRLARDLPAQPVLQRQAAGDAGELHAPTTAASR